MAPELVFVARLVAWVCIAYFVADLVWDIAKGDNRDGR